MDVDEAEVERLRQVERRAAKARDGLVAPQTAVQLRQLLEWILTGNTETPTAVGQTATPRLHAR
jgi:hypothetical protein